MKNRILAQRLAEFEARKGEFPSCLDFVSAREAKSRVWKGLGQRTRKGGVS